MNINWERIGLTIWKWTWRFIRVFLLFIAVFVLHPLVVGGILYTALMFAIFDDVGLDNVHKWDDLEGDWFLPKLENALGEIFNPLFQDHTIAAWIGVAFVLLLWIAVWGYFGYEMHKFLKKNILRLKGWSSGLIVANTRFVSKEEVRFEGYTLIGGDLSLLLEGRKLYEYYKDDEGNKLQRELKFTYKIGRLEEYIFTVEGLIVNKKHGNLVFKLPDEEYEIMQQKYWREVAEWKIKVQTWKSNKNTTKPLKPVHPALLSDMKVFGRIRTSKFIDHDFENLTNSMEEVYDAIAYAKDKIKLYTSKIDRARDNLKQIKHMETLDQIVNSKVEAEKKLVIWKRNLKTAKDKYKEIKKENRGKK